MTDLKQKIETLAADPAATEGERQNANAALERLQARPVKKKGKHRRPHGHVRERSPGSWELRFSFSDPTTGHRRTVTSTVRGNAKEAETELRKRLKAVDDHLHVNPDKITLSDWVDRWIDGRQVAERTRERYESILRKHVLPTLGARRLQSLMPTDLDKLYSDLGKTDLAPRTVHHVHVYLSACLKTAVKKSVLMANPADRADAPRVPSEPHGRALDAAQLKALVAGFKGHPLYAIVAVAAWTGARRNEILALRWSDFDPVLKTLRIERSEEETKKYGRRTKEPKTARGVRTIAIDDGLVSLLISEREKYLRIVAGVDEADLSLVKLPEGALIFPASGDLCKLRDANAVTRTFIRRAKKMLGFAFRFHDLRGSHETVLLDAGIPVHVVAARCGHDPAILLKAYAKRTAGADQRAAEVIGAAFR